MTKTFPAKRDELDAVLGFVEEALEQYGCSMKAQMALSVCVEEVFINIASYAYPEECGTAEVSVETDDEARFVSICFADKGIPFDPLQKEDPDTTLPAEARGIGGLGILMVKKMTDDVSYEYKDGRNVLTMKKAL